MLHRLIFSSMVITVSILLLATIAGAQENLGFVLVNIGYGNAFRGFPGAVSHHNLVLGAEYAPRGTLGAGVELQWSSLCKQCESRGSFSANGYYHFLLRRRWTRYEPFATAGYTRSIGPQANLNMLNYGGGTDFFGALRLELRDAVSFTQGPAHFPEIEVSVAIPGLIR